MGAFLRCALSLSGVGLGLAFRGPDLAASRLSGVCECGWLGVGVCSLSVARSVCYACLCWQGVWWGLPGWGLVCPVGVSRRACAGAGARTK
ncbi:hypothetical protein SEA_KUDEFRE_141 [Gordonia phage Kudefre]|uniref:Uncharacterized protein n=1 Tax=Gordonia phage Kudefre TaxID=2885975 RepID=A0AAE8Y6S5_9CAUD|nr:hypothetical protein L3Y24_gp102 [Gordonia phage Kudefre]UDL15374.1 hypothetical protein SEA_KUDEFRE_141 [Gordonia phage Kudefre]